MYLYIIFFFEEAFYMDMLYVLINVHTIGKLSLSDARCTDTADLLESTDVEFSASTQDVDNGQGAANSTMCNPRGWSATEHNTDQWIGVFACSCKTRVLTAQQHNHVLCTCTC